MLKIIFILFLFFVIYMGFKVYKILSSVKRAMNSAGSYSSKRTTQSETRVKPEIKDKYENAEEVKFYDLKEDKQQEK